MNNNSVVSVSNISAITTLFPLGRFETVQIIGDSCQCVCVCVCVCLCVCVEMKSEVKWLL